MADKFMGIGGRTVNGRAKPITVNEQGRLETIYTSTRELFQTGDINSGAILESGIMESDGYESAVLYLAFNKPIEVYIQYYVQKRSSPVGDLEGLGYQLIYRGYGRQIHNIEYELPTQKYSIRIKNTSSDNGFLSSNIETRKNNPTVQKVEDLKRNSIFKKIDLEFPAIPAGESRIVDFPSDAGRTWLVKFMTADINPGSSASGNVILEWRLGGGDSINRFMQIYGYPRVYLTPGELTHGRIYMPYQFDESKITQFWEHLSSVGYIGNTGDGTRSRFIITNNSNSDIDNPRVSLYVEEVY